MSKNLLSYTPLFLMIGVWCLAGFFLWGGYFFLRGIYFFYLRRVIKHTNLRTKCKQTVDLFRQAHAWSTKRTNTAIIRWLYILFTANNMALYMFYGYQYDPITSILLNFKESLVKHNYIECVSVYSRHYL